MKIWIITNSADAPSGTYVSAWTSEEAARRETDRLNEESRAKWHGRSFFDYQEDELNG